MPYEPPAPAPSLAPADDWIPLTVAAQRLGLTWHATWARLLRGDLDGQKQQGRWLVTTASVERARAARPAVA